MNHKRKYVIILLICMITSGINCKKFVTANVPITNLTSGSVFTTDAGAISVLTGMYAQVSASNVVISGRIPSLTLYCGLSADEFSLWSGLSMNIGVQAYYTNGLSSSTGYGTEFWTTLYPFIYSCNIDIGALPQATGLTPAIKRQLTGEAKFLRAFFYFYLVNLYGDVPMPLDSNYAKNSLLARTPVKAVYQQIIADLHDAQGLLSSQYLDGTLLNSSMDRVRPTSWAATALLARAYLYSGKYSGADSAASVVLGNTSLFALSSLDTAFLRASINGAVVNNEAIWQLQPVEAVPANTFDAYAFIIPPSGLGTGGNFGAYLSSNLLGAFENGDLRMEHWVDSFSSGGSTYYYPYKYKINSATLGTPVTEYSMMLRLSEQYLIRAEARANEGNLPGALQDLNVVRARAGLNGLSASSQSGVLGFIYHESQVELFAELGHRWLDLKRTARVDSVMTIATPEKAAGMTWNSYQQLYPIRNLDIQLDGNLTQNPGY